MAGNVLLVPAGEQSKPEDVNKGLLNLQSQVDKNATDITAQASIIGQGTVDGVAKKLMWKTITGTTTNTGSTNVPHNLDSTKINGVICFCNNSSISRFFFQDWQGGPDIFYYRLTTTDVELLMTNNYYLQPYTITIFYYE